MNDGIERKSSDMALAQRVLLQGRETIRGQASACSEAAMKASTMDEDAVAMAIRDEAHAAGARICPTCDGTGAVLVVEPFDHRYACCPKCNGETWVDAKGRPHKID